MIINILTRKRVTLVAAIIILLGIYIIGKKSYRNVKTHLFMGIILICVCVVLSQYSTIFARILTTIEGFFGDGTLYAATGGRDVEIEHIVQYINTNKIMWLTGIGFGGQVWVGNVYRHYSHFTPLGYIMTGGVMFSFIIYGKLIWLVITNFSKGIRKELKNIDIPFVMLLLFVVATSLLGPNLFSNAIYWFFIGINVAIAKEKQYIVILKA